MLQLCGGAGWTALKPASLLRQDVVFAIDIILSVIRAANVFKLTPAIVTPGQLYSDTPGLA